ncbi:hypothetical protein ACJIZ3_023592 [Penstemon smallii]|uniref:Uncharacterized protein n=1 Tax=Penstemon smallii TaxID=265156 RepID=A0ABD3TPI1_9LAMI
MHKKSALPNGDQLSQEATVEKQKTFGHQKLAMQKKSALPNGDQAMCQQKLAMQKKFFFDTIEVCIFRKNCILSHNFNED